MKKNELLSIGEMAKFTGVGIQALRYYERKNILKPAYTDPDSGYRYYSFEQANSIDVILACVALDIPLKELTDLFNTEDFQLLQEFFVRNKKAAERKLKSINTMLCLADKSLDRMETNKPYEIGQMYQRKFPEKVYYVKPCGQTLENANRTKLLVEFAEETKAYLMNRINTGDISESMTESMVLMEYGFLCKHSPTGTQYFTFTEVPKDAGNENIITIPSGTYYFNKDKTSKIENAPNIFKQNLEGNETFMIIEVEEIISGKTKINEPIYELRLVL